MLIHKLDEKIDSILQTLRQQRADMQDLRVKVATLTTQNEEKDRQISQLYEQIAQKDSEVQKLIDKIQNILQDVQ